MTDKTEELRELAAIGVSGVAVSSELIQKKVLANLLNHTPTILYGPPGTGKTRHALAATTILRTENRIRSLEITQFHKESSYSNFIEGFTATEGGFKRRDGIFKAFCKKCVPGADALDVFIIDEINRADVATVFGEVLYAIEDRKTRSVTTSVFHEDFRMPESLSIVGTMNTADRSIALIDFAFRRRFSFIPVYPDYQELHMWLSAKGFQVTEFDLASYVTAIKVLNERILQHPLLGKNFQLGQAFFVPKTQSQTPMTVADLTDNLNHSILPQLESYFGLGRESELANLIGDGSANAVRKGRLITQTEAVGLIRVLASDKQASSPNK